VGYALQKNIEGLKADLKRYRIVYDRWFSESSLYEKGEVEETLALLRDSHYTYEKEGALGFRATAFGCEKDEVLVRANGLCTYFAADIADHRNKFLKRGLSGASMSGSDTRHVSRMKERKRRRLRWCKLDVILMSWYVWYGAK
jgi:arginyl-tRNA synthetase